MVRALTERQDAFCEIFVANGSNGSEAARAAGYRSDEPRVDAYKLLKLPHIQSRIFELTRQRVTTVGPKMLKVLMDLATSARSEKVRFDAAKDLLDRAGFKPVERILSLTQDKPDLSPEQLRDRATQLLQDIFDEGPEVVVERLNSNPVPAQDTDHDTPMSPNR